MSDAIHPEDMKRIDAAVRWVERQQAGSGSAQPRRAVPNTPDVSVVRCTSATAADGHYPGKIVDADVNVNPATYTDGDDCWLLFPDGSTPTAGATALYTGRLSGVWPDDGYLVFLITGAIGSTEAAAGGGDVADRDTTGTVDHGENTGVTDGAQEFGGFKAFVHGLLVGPQVPISGDVTGGTVAFVPVDVGAIGTVGVSDNWPFAASDIMIQGQQVSTANTLDILVLPTDATNRASLQMAATEGGDIDDPAAVLWVQWGTNLDGDYEVGTVSLKPGIVSVHCGTHSTGGSGIEIGSRIELTEEALAIHCAELGVHDDDGTLLGTAANGTDTVGNVFVRGICTTVGSGGAGVTSLTLTQPAAGFTITGSGVAITTTGTPTFALANDLAALEALSGTDTIYYRSGADTWTAVTVGSGLDFTGGTLTATGAVGADLTAIEALTGTGLAARTADDTWALRTLTGTADKITVTNGSGAAGNPTVTIAATYEGQNSIVTVGTVTAGEWRATVVAPQFGGTGVNGLTAANGTVLIGNGSGYTLATMTAGDGVAITNGSGTITVAITEASQAEMEAASASNRAVTPRRVNHNPGVAKGWVYFDGSAGTPAPIAGHNVNSITDSTTGSWVVVWGTDFSTANYCVNCSSEWDSGVAFYVSGINGDVGLSTGSAPVVNAVVGGGLADARFIMVSAFGDQ
jgi:hypothetical protein